VRFLLARDEFRLAQLLRWEGRDDLATTLERRVRGVFQRIVAGGSGSWEAGEARLFLFQLGPSERGGTSSAETMRPAEGR
jgi:hypothetical protein